MTSAKGTTLGSLNVPLYSTLPDTGRDGSLGVYNGTIYRYGGGSIGWIPLYPVFIQDTQPLFQPDLKYLWINTSGSGDATLWVEDGSQGG